MFLDKLRVAELFGLTLALLVGALSLHTPSAVFAASRSAQPASLGTSSNVRLRLCNADVDHDSDDLCRVIGDSFIFGYNYFMRNRFLSPKNLDFDQDTTFPLKLTPYARNFSY